MPPDGSVILRLDNDEGLRGWKCYVFKQQQITGLRLKLANDSVSFEFQPNKLVDPETVFWCTNEDRSRRSNQVIIRTSGRCSIHADSGLTSTLCGSLKATSAASAPALVLVSEQLFWILLSDKVVLMEMYFSPVMAGDPLTLRCLLWAMEEISSVGFYKNNQLLEESSSLDYKISPVTEADQGDYMCYVTITGKGQQVSDAQELLVQGSFIQPEPVVAPFPSAF